MKQNPFSLPKSYVIKSLLCILVPAAMLILLLVLIGLFELPDELFLAVLLLWTSNLTSNQAVAAIPAGVRFEGEYRIADGS
jgi:hypothetical protein